MNIEKYLLSLFGMSDFRDLSDFGSVGQEKFGITHTTLQMECVQPRGHQTIRPGTHTSADGHRRPGACGARIRGFSSLVSSVEFRG